MVATFNPDQVYFAIALLIFAFVSNILWSCITWKHQRMVKKQLHLLDFNSPVLFSLLSVFMGLLMRQSSVAGLDLD